MALEGWGMRQSDAEPQSRQMKAGYEGGVLSRTQCDLGAGQQTELSTMHWVR